MLPSGVRHRDDRAVSGGRHTPNQRPLCLGLGVDLSLRQFDGSQAWKISIDRWSQAFEIALWFRAVEQIHVPTAGIVPGPIDLDPVPARSTDQADSAEMAAGWRVWWEALATAPTLPNPAPPLRPPERGPFDPPHFGGLVQWAPLQRAAENRWRDACQWNAERLRVGLDAETHRERLQEGLLVAEVEQSMGRSARSFDLELVVLPVRDDHIRALSSTRHLVPESLYSSEGYEPALRRIITALV